MNLLEAGRELPACFWCHFLESEEDKKEYRNKIALRRKKMYPPQANSVTSYKIASI